MLLLLVVLLLVLVSLVRISRLFCAAHGLPLSTLRHRLRILVFITGFLFVCFFRLRKKTYLKNDLFTVWTGVLQVKRLCFRVGQVRSTAKRSLLSRDAALPGTTSLSQWRPFWSTWPLSWKPYDSSRAPSGFLRSTTLNVRVVAASDNRHRRRRRRYYSYRFRHRFLSPVCHSSQMCRYSWFGSSYKYTSWYFALKWVNRLKGKYIHSFKIYIFALRVADILNVLIQEQRLGHISAKREWRRQQLRRRRRRFRTRLSRQARQERRTQEDQTRHYACCCWLGGTCDGKVAARKVRTNRFLFS